MVSADVVDSILEKIKDPNGSALSDEFRATCLDLLESIAQSRQQMHFRLYNHDLMTIFINELHYSALLHRGERRKNGELVFNSHLIGTVKNLINDQHLTGLTTLISGLKHDDIEDFGLNTDNLFRTRYYEDQLRVIDRTSLIKLQHNVMRIVSGTTKVRLSTRQETKEETFRKLLEFIRDYGIRVGYVKIADRTHNIKTLSGHGGAAFNLQKEIATETEDVYVRLARLFKISVSANELLLGCCAFFNPDFLDDFRKMQQEKNKEYLAPFKQKILDQFMDKDHYSPKFIRDIQFVPRTLEFTLHKFNIHTPVRELDIANLPIDYLDPMFDTIIVVDNSKKISPIIGRVIEKFAVGRLNIAARQLRFQRGTLLQVYNKSFGGRLFFRINDSVSEARSRRGLLANAEDDTPHELKERIITILNRVAKGSHEIFAIAREELFQPWIVVYTPKNLAIELPRGATSLDFADKIHEDVLKGLQSVTICEDLWGKNKREVPPFEALPEGVVVFVDSCLSSARGRTPDQSKIKVDPGWLLFCQSGTRARLAKYLRSSDELALEKGRAFLDRVGAIFSTSAENLRTHIRNTSRTFTRADDLLIDRAIGRGDLNLVEAITMLDFFNRSNYLYVEVWLRNQPMELASFAQKLSPQINIEQTRFDLTTKGTVGKVTFKVQFDAKNMSIYDFAKNIVKVNYYGYKLRVFS